MKNHLRINKGNTPNRSRSEKPLPFDWTIDEEVTWPPDGRPKPPFGPTTLEVMRSCPLRILFETSKGYERRTDFTARIGTAFHRALQSLSEDPPYAHSVEGFAQEAQRRFFTELEAQEQQRAQRPREHTLPIDEVRIARAAEAVIIEARRIAGAVISGPHPQGHDSTTWEDNGMPSSQQVSAVDSDENSIGWDEGLSSGPVVEVVIEVEQEVGSADGLFKGRIDCAEHLPEGTRLLDYKSALRDDLPGRYQRQVQLYAYLWHETRGEWPVAAEVVYPFTSATFPVEVDPDTCKGVAEDYRTLVGRLMRERSPDRLAIPSDGCQVCDFRPWCRPFWGWQASERSHTAALEKARFGFEGIIEHISTIEQYWKLIVTWRECPVRIVAPVERFPQLKQAQVGMKVRCLEMPLHGQRFEPRATITEYSEILLLTQTPQ